MELREESSVADQNEQQQKDGEQGQTAQISGTVQIKQQGGDKQPEAKPEEKPEETPEKKSRRKFIVIAVVLFLLVVAVLFYWRSTYSEDTDDAQVDGNLYQVSARVSGQVVHVDVEEQQLVHAGDPIAEVDPKDYEVALEQAQASLANAQAQYEQASVNVPITRTTVTTTLSTSGSDVLGSEASVSQAEAQAQAARARVQAAKATALKSQLDVDRYTPLVAKDVISKQQYDAAVAQATADQASLDEAERNVKAQQDMVHQAQQRLASSESQEQQSRTNGPKQVAVQRAMAEAALAAVKQAQAKVDQAQLNLGYAKILSPIDGIVSKKSVAVGQNLSVGQSLMTVVPLKDLWVTANFKETQLKEMKQNQKVELKVDALGGRKFTGVVQQIGGATGSSLSLFPPENATGNYVKVVQRIPVRINFTNLDKENQDLALRIGMSVTPTVRVKD
jgi:membrane fusion protein, multidrug efflux system